jgi:hypothetical protein
MKLATLISQIDYLYGRQPQAYMFQLVNDCLDQISIMSQMYKKHEIIDLNRDQRLYNLPADLLQIERCDILNTDDRYCMIPKLTDGFHLLKNDIDMGKGDYSHIEDSQLEMDLRDSTGLPEALHQSVLDCVKYRLAEDKGDMQKAMYFKKKFDIFVKKYPYSKDGSRRILTTRV